ncbi:MAG: hypothetical protein SCM96_15195 [Acidobacteriota bacterium]|nr:hypothetical protein [Acidobacteriota bacterium]
MIGNRLKAAVRLGLLNMKGWRTKRKIVVFESDDWGSIRMPSRDVYQKCLAAGYGVDKIKIEKYDSLESEDDLIRLFEVLSSFKDQKGNHPVFTANCLVANPDFEKIKKHDFQTYQYELVAETFIKYPNHSRSFSLWLEGLKAGVFFPQSHGREHLNVSLFMTDLQAGKTDVHFGFLHGMPGSLSLKNYKEGNLYVETLNYNSRQDKRDKLNIILEGLDLFERLFGFKSYSLIPPNYIWSHDYDEAVKKKGVKYFQGLSRMLEPDLKGGFNYFNTYLGKKNEYDQYYLVRNCVFEPSTSSVDDPIDHCLTGIDVAFRWKKPAIINTHRVNYIGSIFQENADRSLQLLTKLLKNIIKYWPDVEFMNSVNIGRLICK